MGIHGSIQHHDTKPRLLGVMLTALAVIAVSLAWSPRVSAASLDCTPIPSSDGNEPVCNPFLADSPWPGAQRGSYAQHSSPLPGPTGPANRVVVAHLSTPSVPVVLSFSPAYPDGKRVIWASTVGFAGEVLRSTPSR